MVFKEQGLEYSKTFLILQKKDLRRTVKMVSAKMVKITNYEVAILPYILRRKKCKNNIMWLVSIVIMWALTIFILEMKNWGNKIITVFDQSHR